MNKMRFTDISFLKNSDARPCPALRHRRALIPGNFSLLYCTGLVFAALCAVPALSVSDDRITFRHTFEKGIEPDFASGTASGKAVRDKELIAFTEGLAGKGFLTGKRGQALEFSALHNISAKAGTVAFWMRGLKGVRWNRADDHHYWFFQLFGANGWVRLYKYYVYDYTFLLNDKHDRINLPNAVYREDEWNLFAFTWNEFKIASFFVNGVEVGRERNFRMPEITAKSRFVLGQTSSGEENRIMDNLTIYTKALSNYEIMDIFRREGDFVFDQQVAIGKTDAAVIIDGSIGKDEWTAAAMIPVAIENHAIRITDTISYVRLMYDNHNLYVALHSPIPAADLAEVDERLLHGFFKQDATDHGQKVYDDDFFTVELSPATDDGYSDLYRFAVNTINSSYSDVQRQDGAIERAGAGDWQVKSATGEKGWILEARIPFAGLETTSPAHGEKWKANFLRAWKHLRKEIDSWTMGRRRSASEKLELFQAGRLMFQGADAVTVGELNIAGLDQLLPRVSFRLFNQSTETREVAVILATEYETLLEKKIILGGERTHNIQWRGDLRESWPTQFMIKCSDAADENIVYHSSQLPVFSERLVDVTLRLYPSSQTARITANVAALEVSAAELLAKVTVMREDTTVGNLTYSFVPNSALFEKTIDLSGLKPGDYRMLVEFIRGEEPENAPVKVKKSFTLQPLPEWYGNKLGVSDDAPEPWIPLEVDVDSGRIGCWGRDYTFGGRSLPAQIRTGRQELLTGPVKLLLTVNGNENDINLPTAPMLVKEKTPGKVKWQTSVADAGITLVTEQLVEFDGMLWTKMTLKSKDDSVALEAVKMLLPLKRRVATLINPYDYSLSTTGYLSENGWSGSNLRVWLGNEEGGLQLFAERGFPTQAIVSEDEVLVEIDFGEQLNFGGEKKIAFGLQATPVKPMHPDYRKWRLGDRTIHLTPEDNIEIIEPWAPTWSRTGASLDFYPIPKKNLTKARFEGLIGGRNYSRFAYFMLHDAWTETVEFQQFGNEWLRNVDEIPRSERASVCQAARSFQDFVLHGFDLLQKQANPRGYYFDCSRPVNCNNSHHGCGYADETTIIHQPTFNILGAREMAKRIYFHLKKHRPDGMIIYHMSGQVLMPLHSFADILVDGENTYARLDRNQNRGYKNFLTLDTYRAEYMGHNFGPAVALLPQFTRRGSIRGDEAESVGPLHAEYVLGLVLLHDSQLWPGYFYDIQPLKDMYTAFANHDFAVGGYEFIPYWKQTVTPEMNEDEAVASFYCKADRQKALMVFMNMSGEHRRFSFPLDTTALGFEPRAVINAVHGEKVVLEDGKLTIGSVPSHTYRLLVLETR